MKIICPNCKSVYNIPEERLPHPTSKASCNGCGSVLLINKETGVIEVEAASADSAHDAPYNIPETSKGEGGRDRLATGVFIAGLILLMVTGYFAIGSIRMDDISRSFKSLTQRFMDVYMREMGLKDRPGKVIKSLKPEVGEPQQHLLSGHKLFKSKQFDEAIEEYNKAIEFRPSDHEAYYWRGRAYSEKGGRDKAIEDFKKTIELNPSYTRAYESMGWLYTQMAKWDESIRYFDKAIELSPKNGWAYYNRGRCYYNKGDLKMALEDSKKACDLGYEAGCKVHQSLKK